MIINEVTPRQDTGAPASPSGSRASTEPSCAVSALTGFDPSRCLDCGGPNPVWFAPNHVWNYVMGGPDAKDDPGGYCCPVCFIARAESAGYARTAWELVPRAAAQRTRESADVEKQLLDRLDGKWRILRDTNLGIDTKNLIKPAQRLQKRGLVESKLGPGYILVYRLTAIAMEARQGGDGETRPHPKDDSAVPAGETPDA